MVGQRSTGKANPVTQPELWDPCEGRNAACQTVQQFHPKFIPKRLERRKGRLTSRMSPDLLQGIREQVGKSGLGDKKGRLTSAGV